MTRHAIRRAPASATASLRLARTASLAVRHDARRAAHSGYESARPKPVAYWGRRFVACILIVWAASLVIGFMHALTVLMFASLAVSFLGLRRPEIGLIGISMLCTLAPIATPLIFTGGLWRWNTVNYSLLLVQIVFVRFLLKLKDPHTRLLKVFIGVLVVQLLVTPDFGNGTQEVLEMLTPFALLIYFGRAANDNETWYWLAAVAGTLAAAGGLVYYQQVESLPPLNENVSAYFPLTAIFAICLGIRFADNPRKRRTLTALAIANFIWVFLSGSRGATLVALCCFVFFISQLPGVKARLLFSASLVVMAFAIAAAFPRFRDHALNKLQRLTDPTLSADQRTNGRSDLMAGGLRMFREHPLGIGTGGFRYNWARLNSVEGQKYFYRVGEMAPAHAGWITVLAENGVVGVACLSSFLLSFTVVPLMGRRKGTLAIGIFVTITLAVALTASDVSQMGLWFLAAGVITLLRRAGATGSTRPVTVQQRLITVAGLAEAR